MNKWERMAGALARLAEDQSGKPEGDVARDKLAEILAKHPEARSHPPVMGFMARDITLREFHGMRRAGVDTDGTWTGANFQDAIRNMQNELRDRMARQVARQMMETLNKEIIETLFRVRRTDVAGTG